MVALVSKTGAVFSMLTLALSLTEALLLSVKLTAQTISSLGLAMEDVSCSVEALPSALPVVLLQDIL